MARPVITFQVEGVNRVQKFLQRVPISNARLRQDLEHELAKEAAKRVKRLAPRRTGRYADHHIMVSGGTVFTDFPAANRLENGFVGMDALGRHYTQMPRPHWSPVREQMREEYPKAVHEMTRRDMKRIMERLRGDKR